MRKTVRGAFLSNLQFETGSIQSKHAEAVYVPMSNIDCLFCSRLCLSNGSFHAEYTGLQNKNAEPANQESHYTTCYFLRE